MNLHFNFQVEKKMQFTMLQVHRFDAAFYGHQVIGHTKM